MTPKKDDGTIDISWMDPDQAREHLRRLADLCSCPCYTCRAICDRPAKIYECDAYQLWYDERMRERHERMG